jgi:sugar-phosphatase
MRWLQHAEMADVDGIVAIDGIAAFLERLDPEAWAIVTSAPRDLAIKRLGAVELPLPRVMVAAEDVARGKPDPEGFLKAAEMLGVDIRECLIFEDSPAGIAAGKASGAHVAIVGDLVEAGDGELVIPNYA